MTCRHLTDTHLHLSGRAVAVLTGLAVLILVTVAATALHAAYARVGGPETGPGRVLTTATVVAGLAVLSMTGVLLAGGHRTRRARSRTDRTTP